MLAGETFETSGTVTPAEKFDAEQDAHRFKTAMEGWGCKKEEIIRLVALRSSEQLKATERAYKASFGKDLLKDLESELKGHFETVVLKRFWNRHELAAVRCREAMKGPGANKKALIQTICPKLPADITAMKEAFKAMFPGRDLEKDVQSETSGDLKKILISLLSAGRDPETTEVDQDKARKEALELWNAGEGTSGKTDKATFNRIIATRSRAQLGATFAHYAHDFGEAVEKAIEKVMSGNLKQAHLAVVKTVASVQAYYAEQIYKTMKGLGTSDNELVQLVVERCEIDTKEIKVAFEEIDGKSMAEWIKDDTSGDYRNALLALIGEFDVGKFADEEPAGGVQEGQDE